LVKKKKTPAGRNNHDKSQAEKTPFLGNAEKEWGPTS